MKEGIYKKVNDSIELIDYNKFIVLEPWTKTRDRLKKPIQMSKSNIHIKQNCLLYYLTYPRTLKILKILSLLLNKMKKKYQHSPCSGIINNEKHSITISVCPSCHEEFCKKCTEKFITCPWCEPPYLEQIK